MTSQTETPLVLIAFNRPQLLRKQLEIVRDSFKGPIFVIIDGPRPHVIGEPELVAEVASLADELCNQFDCQVKKSSENLGCYRQIKSGLDWVFSQVDRAIILEDDCMPSPQFFSFACEMLELYATDERVFSISGTNLFPQISPQGCRHFFTHYHNCWGWGTWARAWSHFIDTAEEWDIIKGSAHLRGFCPNLRSYLYWRHVFDRTFQGEIDSWFYRWLLTCWTGKRLAVVPSVNLIINDGGGVAGTHTKDNAYFNRQFGKLIDASASSVEIQRCDLYDRMMEDTLYSKSFINRCKWAFRKAFMRTK